MKFTSTSYTNGKNILKFADHYVNVSVMVDDTGISANADGKKIVAAGTVVGGAAAAVLSDPTQKVQKKNTQGTNGSSAEGVLFTDVDVTYGPAPGAMLIHGFVDLNKLGEAPCADAVTALKSRVTFLK